MKLLTWNTQWCRGLDGVVSAERIVTEARAMADFDMLCLQEIAVQATARARTQCGHDQPAGSWARQCLPGYRMFTLAQRSQEFAAREATISTSAT